MSPLLAFPFSTYSISFLTDDIIQLRYVSIDGELRKIMVVIKMPSGNHAKEIREYEITSKGVVILGKRLTDYQGLISGVPVHSSRSDLKEEPSHHPQIKYCERCVNPRQPLGSNQGYAVQYPAKSSARMSSSSTLAPTSIFRKPATIAGGPAT